jgi:hypothetical protein
VEFTWVLATLRIKKDSLTWPHLAVDYTTNGPETLLIHVCENDIVLPGPFKVPRSIRISINRGDIPLKHGLVSG